MRGVELQDLAHGVGRRLDVVHDARELDVGALREALARALGCAP